MGNAALYPTDAFPISHDEVPEALQPPTHPVGVGFLAAITLAQAALYMSWAGIGSLILPTQVEQLDPANKVFNLLIITASGAALALVSNPIAGALSDRTTSRMGRRRPWILAGALMGAAALALMMIATSIPLLLIGWSLFQFASNFILAGLTAIIPDQIPETQR